jgi:hypothetical protein
MVESRARVSEVKMLVSFKPARTGRLRPEVKHQCAITVYELGEMLGGLILSLSCNGHGATAMTVFSLQSPNRTL